MTLQKCDMCAKDIDIDSENTYEIKSTWNQDDVGPLCSIDCVLDWAWLIKESQPKLSKSKYDV